MRSRYDPNEMILEENFARILLYDRNQDVKAEALVDLEDVERCVRYKWSLTGDGYVTTKIDGRYVKLHRFVLSLTEPVILSDHRNRIRTDCRRHNLRICSPAQNLMNRSVSVCSFSGYKGVFRNERGKKWKALITLKGKQIYLGCFESVSDAAKAFDKAARKHHGEYAVLNFP